jgi:hypothetical protein
MSKALYLTMFLLVALAVLASGCGSTRTASTNAGTSAPANQTSQAVTTGPSTGATEAQHAATAPKPKAAEAKPERREKAAEAKREPERPGSEKGTEAANPTLEAAERQVPRRRRYPKFFQREFMVRCEAAKGSASRCACIVAKLEKNGKVETGQSLAELLALKIAMEHGASLEEAKRQSVPLPIGVRRDVIACTSK